jgi:hypothetical protein
MIARGFNAPLALVRRRARREVQRLVDHRKILIVVQEARVGVDLRVHADPELHCGLKIRRTRHHILRRTHGPGAEPHERTGEKN